MIAVSFTNTHKCLYTLFFRPQLKYMEYQRAGSEVYYYHLGEKNKKKNKKKTAITIIILV